MIIGSISENKEIEKRISITPETVKKFTDLKLSVSLEKSYGEHLGISDEEYKNKGILPNALINYMLRLGWSHGDDEIISLENAIKWFSLEKMGKSPAKFDYDKLISVNSHYILELKNDEIIKFLKNYYNKKYKIKNYHFRIWHAQRQVYRWFFYEAW